MLEGTMIWIDIETTGLRALEEKILEIGVMVTDTSGMVVYGALGIPVWDENTQYALDHADPWVLKTHDRNGLIEDCKKSGMPIVKAEDALVSYLEDLGVNLRTKDSNHLCGSSVHFDAKFLDVHAPILSSLFHYRMVDITTLKLLCEDLNPNVFERVPNKRGVHRAIPDLKDTISEYFFYRQNFLNT